MRSLVHGGTGRRSLSGSPRPPGALTRRRHGTPRAMPDASGPAPPGTATARVLRSTENRRARLELPPAPRAARRHQRLLVSPTPRRCRRNASSVAGRPDEPTIALAPGRNRPIAPVPRGGGAAPRTSPCDHPTRPRRRGAHRQRRRRRNAQFGAGTGRPAPQEPVRRFALRRGRRPRTAPGSGPSRQRVGVLDHRHGLRADGTSRRPGECGG